MTEKIWYLVGTKPNQEHRAKENLKLDGLEAFYPSLPKVRKSAAVGKALFSRYIFVHCDPEGFHKVEMARGVTRIVRCNNTPMTAPQSVIDLLKDRCDGRGVLLKPAELALKPGDRAKITSGPLKGFEGVIAEKNHDRRVILLVEILGRKTPVEVAPSAVLPTRELAYV